MQQVLQAINNLDVTQRLQDINSVPANELMRLSAINPSTCSFEVGEGATLDLILLHGDAEGVSINIELKRHATLRLTQLCSGVAPVRIDVDHQQGATSKIVAVVLNHAAVDFNLELNDTNGCSELNTLQLGVDKDNNSLKINMRHLAAACASRSLSKCVASGESNLIFDGLVYVAQGAQQTAAEQNCRCVELSDKSHIVAHPQLEIYADDVKCSHGATMGMVDSDAIFYMRQRGLSEAQARRVQIEGFVTDVVDHCEVVEVRDAIKELIKETLENM
ncbi:MAG: SufD family Fe-S cluster assembly protein [Rikenellaceae bacterium]